MNAAPRKVLVIGLGNEDRGDDGIGAIVVRRLAGRLPDDVALRARSGDMLSLIEEWAGFDALVCVDAAAPMIAAGRVHRIDLATETLPREACLASSHAFGLAEAVELARSLGLAPRDIVVYAIEGASFEGGAPPSREVVAAAFDVADRIVAEVEKLRLETREHA